MNELLNRLFDHDSALQEKSKMKYLNELQGIRYLDYPKQRFAGLVVPESFNVRDGFPRIQKKRCFIERITVIGVDLAKKDISNVLHQKVVQSAMFSETGIKFYESFKPNLCSYPGEYFKEDSIILINSIRDE